MASSINRGDPEYERVMREAKELFEAALAKNTRAGRGRPKKEAAAKPAVEVEDEELPGATGEFEIPDDLDEDEEDGEEAEGEEE